VVDLRTGKQMADAQVGTGPSSLAVDAHTGEVFVASSGVSDNTVTVFPAAITKP
jgi:DNA-binding beta-propeller fold protein YncE